MRLKASPEVTRSVFCPIDGEPILVRIYHVDRYGMTTRFGEYVEMELLSKDHNNYAPLKNKYDIHQPWIDDNEVYDLVFRHAISGGC